MLPTHLNELLRERLDTDLRWHTQNIESTRTRAVEKARSLGNDPRTLVTMMLIGESSAHMKAIHDTIVDVVGQVGFDPYDGFSTDLVALYEEFADRQISHVQASLDSWHGKPHNPPIDKDNDLRSTFSNRKNNYSVKIKTLATSVLHPIPNSVMTSINIENSTVGSVSSGNGNVINVSIDSEATRELIEILDSVFEVTRNMDAVDSSELAPVIEETKRELAAEKPNKLKLRGLLTSVASSIKNIGILDKSYKTIATVLESFGVSIPS